MELMAQARRLVTAPSPLDDPHPTEYWVTLIARWVQANYAEASEVWPTVENLSAREVDAFKAGRASGWYMGLAGRFQSDLQPESKQE